MQWNVEYYNKKGRILEENIKYIYGHQEKITLKEMQFIKTFRAGKDNLP